ncbi:hypothetical protein [Sedimentitalea arenosa]|uniref:Uncharacterized protein n=1 Tax=Sedimentitalea arenosa TaxID=2798803 RepID=A0A8J7J398_9RHOB|nr:hypothetical protein [Arenibacterium arenosum]MBJ6370775.1 hypothetical protein [Arenibacterium arenosum]
MKLPNALSPNRMTPLERRAELCRLLALGLVRLKLKDDLKLSAEDGEFPLHNSPDQSGHATIETRRTA